VIQYDLLAEPLISITTPDVVAPTMVSLPELYAALVRDEVTDFPALRPHQRHVWHAFLVQVGALAMHRGGATAPPDTAESWRALLSILTPGSEQVGAWALVAPMGQAALLQPPDPGADVSKAKIVESPDSLDMLVTSRNHDVKRGVMRSARPEHWLYALVSLQTQEGVFGRDNYGISRMNGGFSSRPGFAMIPSGGVGRRVVRDLACLLKLRGEMLKSGTHFKSSGGVGLLWLLPWDGTTSLSMKGLDPFYVEICRRARLRVTGAARLEAMCWGSKMARIESGSLRGVTGDPWAPVVRDEKGTKALTCEPATISYRRLTPLLFPRFGDPMAAQRAPLQHIFSTDDPSGLSLSVTGLVRGQGATEGLHTRRIAVSNTRRTFMAETPTDAIAALAHERVQLAGEFVRTVFYPSALTVFTAAPSEGERERDDDTAKKRSGSWCLKLESAIDDDFFERLDDEAGAPTPDDASMLRREWLNDIGARGRTLLSELIRSAPDAAMRHYRVRVRATDRYTSAFARFLRDAGFEPTLVATSIDCDANTIQSGDDDE
jgi:CRISPR system Cascade subunit CasA